MSTRRAATCGNLSRERPLPLILTQMPPLHWAIAGAGIAVVTLCLLFLANRRLGLSTGFADVCSLVITLPYFRRGSVRSGRRWRLPFVAGLILGGFLSAALSGGWGARQDLGVLCPASVLCA